MIQVNLLYVINNQSTPTLDQLQNSPIEPLGDKVSDFSLTSATWKLDSATDQQLLASTSQLLTLVRDQSELTIFHDLRDVIGKEELGTL